MTQVTLTPTQSPSSPPASGTARVLYVDLDGTLTPSDTLLESALLLLRQHPLNVFRLLAWLLLCRAQWVQEDVHRCRHACLQRVGRAMCLAGRQCGQACMYGK